MSTPQGPQPPDGAPQQPAEQPAWAQQAAGAWGAAPNGHARRDDETRAVPRWNAPETSEVPQQDVGDHVNGAAPAQEVGDSGDSTQVVARGGQQGWNLDETRIETHIVSQPEIKQDGAAQHQGWGEQAHAAPPYASPEQHYGAQQGQQAWGQQYPGQGHPQAQHAQPQAHQAQPASPFAPPGQHDPYGQAQPGSGQPSYGQPYAAQPGHPAQPGLPGQSAQPGQPGQPYGQQPTQQFGQPQFGQQTQQGQQSPWSGQQAGWAPGGPSQQPTQQWGGRPDAQQQWGPSYPSPQDSAAAKSRRTLFVGIAAVVLAVVVGVLGFVAPGFFLQRVLDAAAVQEGVRQVLTQDYGLQVESVTCPEGTAVVADTAFECTAVVDGEQIAVPIRITSGDGNYEVGRPD
jgi:hypothetical protein